MSHTPPSPPSQPLTPTLHPLSDSDATSLHAPPLLLPPSPSLSSSLSSSEYSTYSLLPTNLHAHLPRITITLNDRTIPSHNSLPWRPCYVARSRHDRSFLAPPSIVQAERARLQQRLRLQQRQREVEGEGEVLKGEEGEYQAGARWQAQWEAEGEDEEEDVSVPESNQQGSGSESDSLPPADYATLVPIARELVRWRILNFYDIDSREPASAEERSALTSIILATQIDWSRTWAILQAQRARYRMRIRRTLGLLPSRWMLKGLEVLRGVWRAAAHAGVGREELMFGVEAFAKRDRRGLRGGRVTLRGFVEMKEWGRLAGVLLMDRGGGVCARREEAVVRYFSVLEYEVGCPVLRFCCFRSCGKRRVVYRLSESENARLDGSLELQVQLVHAASTVRPTSRQWQSENELPAIEEELAPEPKTRRRSVRISVDEKQERTSSANRVSWDSEEERQKRRRERREFIFGKEEECEDEIADDEEMDDKQQEQERTRRQSVEKVMAANMKWNVGYAHG